MKKVITVKASGDPAINKALKVLQAHWGHSAFRPAQMTVLSIALGREHDVISVLPTGYGKCLALGTLVLMYDGTLRVVEDVKVGDLLRGPDHRPRTVLNTTRGYGPLYRVDQKRGNPYTVNGNHILSLRTTGQGGKYLCETAGRYVEISVDAWLTASKNFRHIHKGWSAAVEYPKRDVLIDPYFLGVWLGDGSSAKPDVTTADVEIVACVKEQAAGGRAGGGIGHHPNAALNDLRHYDLVNNKHIPNDYQINCREVRAAVLAGLIDTDGTRNGRAALDLTLKNQRLANDAARLAQSLGLHATVVCQTGVSGICHRVSITGNLAFLPCRLKHKKCVNSGLSSSRSAITVTPVGKGEYAGFELDCNQLFLLADHTVTHNSACFQIPALMNPGCTLVISPLIALMKDQCDDCARRNIPAGYVNSHVTDREQDERFENLKAGKYKVFYVAPERVANAQFQEAVSQSAINYLAIDEVHAVSTWGFAFRPAYQRIKDLIPYLSPGTPILGFTATATNAIVDHIAEGVGLRPGYKSVIADPIRPNLNYVVLPGECAYNQLRDLAQGWDLDKGRYVVYAPAIKMVEGIAGDLAVQLGKSRVRFYHGKLQKGERIATQDEFKTGDCAIMVATCAFGMGIDIPNIRAVVHYGIPGSLEAYCQEAGRGGRDGLHADAILLHDKYSMQLQASFVRWANPSYDKYMRLWQWLNENLTGTELLLMGDISICKEVGGGLSGEDVGACLSVLSANGAVERSPIPYGTVLCVDVFRLTQAVAGAMGGTQSVRKVAQAIWDVLVKPQLKKPYPKTYEVGFERETVAEAAGVSTSTVSTAAKWLSQRGVWTSEALDYSRTTRLLRYGEPLSRVLPREIVEEKLNRDQGRLDAMIEYSALPRGGHIPFIREYFLSQGD